ncbi:MAG: fibronectin type III domain-containing protein [Fibrobacterota bacterium]
MPLSQQPSAANVVRDSLTGASRSFISAIGVAPGNSQRVLVGYESGRLDGTSNLSSLSATTWSTLGASALPAGRRILSIKFDPSDAKTIYVTYAGANADNIWRSRDDGITWTALKGALPSASVYDLAILPENPKVIYAATEVGLFASADGGDSWGAPESGPSLTTVRKLKYVDGKLVVGTYGRGVYQLDLKSTSLESPTGFVVTAGNLSATLSWGAVSGASGYQAEIAEGASGPWTTASQVSGINYVHNSFPKRIPYWFRVKALAGTVPGVATTSISVYPFTPDAPTNPTATAGIAKVSLAWSQVAQATSYLVERSTSATGTFTSVGSVSSASFEDINLTTGTTYFYRIVGSNALGRGTPSSVVQATPFADPAAWSDIDIGTGVGGSHTVSGQVHTVKAGGNDIWNLSDNFHFTYRKLTGDGSMSAKVSSLSIVSGSMDPWAKAGLMIREKLTAGSRHAMMEMTSGNGALFQYRQTENGGCGNNIQSGLKAPYWVKIVRQGNVLSGYQSPDGTNWSQIAGANVTLTNLPADLYVGMAVTAHSASSVVSGVFDLTQPQPTLPTQVSGLQAVAQNQAVQLNWTANSTATSYNVRVSTSSTGPFPIAKSGVVGNSTQITGLVNGTKYYFTVSGVNAVGEGTVGAVASATPSAPQSWTEIDIDSWGGSRVVSGTTHTVKGSGSDIWNNSDQFHFSYRTLSGNGTLVAKVVSLGNTNAWAKAGLMFRETTSGNSRNVMVNVTPSNGILLQKRMNPGEASTNTIVSGKAVPQWLKLTRSGNTFTGYLSADGANWTQVGSPVVFGSFSSTALVGLAVTSHNSGAVTTAVFDNVTIP